MNQGKRAHIIRHFAQCAAFVLCGMLVTSVSAQSHSHHTPPSDPKVHPRIAKTYPNDKDGDHIEDALAEKAKRPHGTQTNAVMVNLVFSQQITQEQIDAFEAAGGHIDHVYKTLSYGWSGSIALSKVPQLPQLLGPTLLLVEEPKQHKFNLYNATQTGRARVIWANNFGGSSTGYDGSTNITIGIIDTGVDVSHTDLSGRKVWWYDYSATTNTTALDYYGHGTHVAGIALGTGAAAGSSAAPFSFTLWADLTGASPNNFYYVPFQLPASSITWKAGASWADGGTAPLALGYRTAGASPSSTVTTFTSTTGSSGETVSSTFTPSSSRVYAPILQQGSTTNVADYVITNYISSYPAAGDGFNKFRGVAPGCNWAAAKVSSGTGSTISSASVDAALDDMVTTRVTNKIKIINLSLGTIGSPGLDATERQYVNTAVANGVIVVAAAGNDGEGSTSLDREIDDPARAAYAITVGAMNPTNQLTAYTSQGFTSPGSTTGQEEDYKPDILAPGGSQYYGGILSTDSNTKDGGLSDVKSNDYTPDIGTSMATPFVSGAAALVIDALEQNGHSWDFYSTTDPMYVKMLLCATATECNANRESGSNNPSLERAASGSSGYPEGKDKNEGYGIMNPDAAIEGAIVTFTNNTILTNSMGATVSDRRAWARRISLTTNKTIQLSVSAVSNGDYDLYLYSDTPGTYGKPVILASSTTAATNSAESITYTPYTNMTAIAVVKRVSGSGTFSCSLTNSNDAFTNAWPLPIIVNVPYSTGSNVYFYASGSTTGTNSSYSKDTGETSIGSNASGKTAWYKFVSPITGKIALSVPGSFGVEMFTGSSVSALTSVTKDFNSLRSSNNFTVTAGTTYRVAVDGTNSNSGGYTLSWSVLSATAMMITNSSTLACNSTVYDSPNPSSIIVSGMTQSVAKATVTLNNFTSSNPHIHTFLVSAPNGKGVIVWGRNGGDTGYAFTNITVTFDDSSTNALPDYVGSFTVTNGTYHPACWATTKLTSDFGYGAPSSPYTTNLSDLSGTLSGTWSFYSSLLYSSYVSVITNGWTLNVTFDSPPTLSINSSTLAYTENSAATQISSTATVTDSDSSNFNGGNLTVQFTANGATEDTLTVMNQGTGAGQIGVSGTVVSYGGTNVGYYAGGSSGSALTVYFTNSFATIAAAQQLVTRIGYTNTSDNPSTLTRTVQFTLTDNATGSVTASKGISVSAVNDAPTLSTINTLTGATEDTAFTISYSTLSNAANMADIDSSGLSFRIEGITTGTLTKNGTNVVAGSTLLGSGETLSWTPANNTNGTLNAFTVKAWDGSLASSTAVQVKVTVTAVNDAPTLTTISAIPGAVEDTAFTLSFTTLSNACDIADIDSTSLSFQLASVTSGTLKKNGNAVTNGVTLLGSGETWTWTPATNVFGTNVAAFTVKAYDGSLASASAVQVNITVTNVNDAPTLTTVTNLTGASEDTPFTISYTTLAAAADESDPETNSISFRLENVTSGTLLKNGAAVTNQVTLLSSGETWTWTPATNVNGTNIAAFTVKAWDGALASSTAVQVTVTVSASNDAPLITLDTNIASYIENGSPVIISTNTVVSDIDSTDLISGTLSIQIVTNGTSSDFLILSPEGTSAGQIGVSGTIITFGGTNIGYYSGSVSNTNIMIVTFTNVAATPAAAQRLISRVALTNSSDNPLAGSRSVKFTLADGDGGSSSATTTVNVVAVDDNPSLTIYSGDLYYIENDPATIITTNAVLTDVDSSDFNGGSLTIQLSSAGGSDRLSIVGEGTSSGKIDYSGNVVTFGGTPIGYYSGGFTDNSALVISFTNSAATVTAVQELIMRIGFLNTLDNFSTHTRYVQFIVNDGDGGTNVAAKFIYPQAVNDAPTLSTINTISGTLLNTPLTISYTMLYTNSNISDVDTSATNLSFRVESVSSGSLTKNGTATTNGISLVSTNESLVWTPPTNVTGSAVAAFVVSAYDGSLASTNTVQVYVNVTNINSAPIVANPISTQNWGYGVLYLYQFPANTFIDSDSGQTLSYSATGLPPGLSLNSGTRTISGTPSASGTYSISLIATDNGSPSLSATNTFTFTIATAFLSVTPDNVSRAYGTTNPTLTGTIFGIKNGDNISATYSTTATPASLIDSYPITVTLSDPNNRLTNYSVTLNTGLLTITNTPPTIAITSPTDGTTFNAGSTNLLTVSVSDIDGTVSKVEYFAGTTKLGEVTSSPFNYSWTNTAAGTFSVTAVATDDQDDTTTSAAVSMTFNPYIYSAQLVNSHFGMTFFGTPSNAYAFQYSTNLSDWNTISNVTVLSGSISVTDTNATASTNRFYRFIQ